MPRAWRTHILAQTHRCPGSYNSCMTTKWKHLLSPQQYSRAVKSFIGHTAATHNTHSKSPHEPRHTNASELAGCPPASAAAEKEAPLTTPLSRSLKTSKLALSCADGPRARPPAPNVSVNVGSWKINANVPLLSRHKTFSCVRVQTDTSSQASSPIHTQTQ